jgi:class 3 adenylate cyclase/tetratricopeptide (TPR) repeat protein/ribosomal protein L40E
MRCSKCGAENPTGAKFCIECASPFARRCSSCGSENPPRARFCLECSKPIDSSPAESLDTKEAFKSSVRVSTVADGAQLEGERKTVTALFADIKGSMDLMEDLDPEEARAIVDPALKLMIDATHRYGGYIVQSTGDGIFALFGAPIAYEDHPQRAVFAALRMQEDLKRYADKLRERGQPPLSVRVGVNRGEVVVRSIQTDEAHTEYTPIGHSISLASRLQTLAAPGSVVIGESVRKFVEGYFELKALGSSRIKGVSEAVNVYEVTGLGPLRTRLQRSAGRGLTKFVSRQREMEAMKHAVEQAKAGHGQIVAAIAEPGVGKSRLLREFKAVLQSGWTVLETFSASHRKPSAFLPVIDLLHAYFKITSDDDKRTRREKVSGRILTLDRSLEELLPHLFALLGIVEGDDPLAHMDAQIRKRRTLEAIKRILVRESLNQPLMVIFEDLHWIDEETQGLLNLLADSIGTAKILLLVNYRPEYTHQWGSKTYYTQLRLDPLSKESAEEMLSGLLGDTKNLVSLKRLIVERAEGNPFFIEEMVQVLLDEGALVRDGAAVRLTKALGELKIPPTVQDILASRIDRLPPAEKDLLQTLAVIGREFALGLVQRVVSKSEDELDRMLHALQLAEFIYEQPAAGDIEYIFKHAQTQEVAYKSVLIERRKALHERAARSIEIVFADRLDDKLSLLANHYSHSGNAAKAVFYLDLAAQRAMRGSAYGEAVALLSSALQLVKTLPDERERDRIEISLCLNLYEARKAVRVRGFASEETLNRARELCEKIRDDSELFKVLEHLADHHGNRLDAGATRAVRDDLLRVAKRIKDPSLLARVHYGLGRTFMLEGDFSNAEDQFKRVIDSPGGDRGTADQSALELKSSCYGLSAWNIWLLGNPTKALIRSRESVVISTALGWPLFSARSLAASSALHLLMRSPEGALQSAEAALEICQQQGLSNILALSRFYRGWALIQRGDTQEGMMILLARADAEDNLFEGRPPMLGIADRIRKRAARDGGWGGSTLTRLFICLAEGCLSAGYFEQGLEVTDGALAVAHTSGVTMYEAETYRLKGELLLAQDTSNAAQADQSFRTAIEVARKQDSKSWELRATMSLARLLAKQGKRDEARAMLAEIYNWFTEGFDTADQKDAKALLETLAP